jgi:transcriptional regulator with XRE-family HTH domain
MSEKEWAEIRGAVWAAVIAANVRAAREAARLSQSQLGERAGMVVPVISRLESGKHLPSLASFLKVAEALGVPPGELLREPAVSEPEPPAPASKSRRGTGRKKGK